MVAWFINSGAGLIVALICKYILIDKVVCLALVDGSWCYVFDLHLVHVLSLAQRCAYLFIAKYKLTCQNITGTII